MEVYPLVNIPNNWALNVWIAAGQPLPGRIARNTMGNFANYSICRRWATCHCTPLQEVRKLLNLPTMGNFANYSICRRWATCHCTPLQEVRKLLNLPTMGNFAKNNVLDALANLDFFEWSNSFLGADQPAEGSSETWQCEHWCGTNTKEAPWPCS